MGRTVTFINTRTRFQRLEDARIFSGWVSFLNAKVAVVSVTEDVAVHPGQTFLFQVFGRDATATFTARLEVVSGSLLAFGLTTSIRNTSSGEDMRLRARLSAEIYSCPPAAAAEGEEASELSEIQLGGSYEALGKAQVVDISSKGLGFISSRAFARGDRLKLLVETPWGATEFVVEVRYSKQVGSGFRVGVRILEMDRLNQGRYSRLIQNAAAA